MKKTFCRILAMILCFSLVTPAFALEGVWELLFSVKYDMVLLWFITSPNH